MTSPVLTVIDDFKRGRAALLADDTGEETRVAFIFPAAASTEDLLATAAVKCRGLVLAPAAESHLAELGLGPMVPRPPESALPFTISVEARRGVTTGISAADRAETLRTLATTASPRQDLVAPGHIFPIHTRNGGVLLRTSAMEAAVDLVRLAGLPPVAAFTSCLGEDGEHLPFKAAQEFAARESLSMVSVSEVIRHRLATERVVEEIANAFLPTKFAGDFRAICFRSIIDGAEHIALVRGTIPTDGREVLARVQAEQLLGDLFGDGIFSLDALNTRSVTVAALKAIDRCGTGAFIYIRHPRHGLLESQVKSLADGNYDGSHMSRLREFGLGAQILSALGITKVKLLSNSQRELRGISAFHLEITGRQRLVAEVPGDSGGETSASCDACVI